MSATLLFLFPLAALAFSSGPSRQCQQDADCVLVRELVCGGIDSVALNQDKAWADLQARRLEESSKAGQKAASCGPGPRPDHRKFSARCVSQVCVAQPKP